jgi:hypothetical protein
MSSLVSRNCGGSIAFEKFSRSHGPVLAPRTSRGSVREFWRITSFATVAVCGAAGGRIITNAKIAAPAASIAAPRQQPATDRGAGACAFLPMLLAIGVVEHDGEPRLHQIGCGGRRERLAEHGELRALGLDVKSTLCAVAHVKLELPASPRGRARRRERPSPTCRCSDTA